MLVYYIAEIEGDQYHLKTPMGRYSRDVDIDGLIEIAKTDTVVGYNRVTGKVSVKTAKDVFGYINSRRKLVGLKPLDPYVRVIDSAEVSYDEVTNVLTLYVTDKDSDNLCMESLYDTVEIRWISILDVLKKVNHNCEIHIDLDISSYRVIKGRTECKNRDIFISKVTLLNEHMFYNCDSIDGLFRFTSRNAKNLEVDMSRCRIKQPFTALDMFMNVIVHEFPDGFVKYLRNCNDLCYNCSLDYSLYTEMLRDSHKSVDCSTVFNSCKILGEVTYDEIIQIQDMIGNDSSVEILVFDRSDYAFDTLYKICTVDNIKITSEFKGALTEESLKVLKEFMTYISLKPEVVFNKDIKTQGMFLMNLKYLTLGITSDLMGVSVQGFLKDKIKEAIKQGYVNATTLRSSFYMNSLIKKFYKYVDSYVNNAQIFSHFEFNLSNLGTPTKIISNLDDEEVRVWWFLMTAVNDASIYDDYKYNLERYEDK